MTSENENARAGTRALRNKEWNGNYKRMPAYGKAILELRQSGKMPAGRVIVSYSWDIGKAYPRIVLADETPPERLAFWYLAGLHIQVVCGSNDTHRVNALVDEILKINPASLIVFDLDLIETSFALTIIKPPEFACLSEAA